MKTSKNGIELIKKFEGLRLKAYKPVKTEKYYTIGYGHYGTDVKANSVITEQDAENFLINDLKVTEMYVNSYNHIYKWTQNEFDALVSFTYNCGKGNLDMLLGKGTRNKVLISNKIILYNKAGGKVLKGLVRRRAEEQKLFLAIRG